MDSAQDIATAITPDILRALYRRVKKLHTSKYEPHQNTREMQRRMRQIRKGALKGDYIALDARLHAAGLTAPTDVRLTEPLAD